MNSDDTAAHQTLKELYVQACGDLLSAYGLQVNAERFATGTPPRMKSGYVSILNAGGPGIQLLSMLAIDQNLVVVTHPAGRANIPQVDLEDWCRELNNQLVGRMKNKLLGFGHVIEVGLPVLITGTDVSPVPQPDSQVHAYSVEAEGGQVTCTLTTLVEAELEFTRVKEPADGEDVLLEGAMSFF
jgi:hypothetical protein